MGGANFRKLCIIPGIVTLHGHLQEAPPPPRKPRSQVDPDAEALHPSRSN